VPRWSASSTEERRPSTSGHPSVTRSGAPESGTTC